ncbi:MAG: hypothetical protein JOZ72_16705 [Alphaproteobacteria bacterium]|nr:hypothetical protein [Alphaproteobacteria bacterium]
MKYALLGSISCAGLLSGTPALPAALHTKVFQSGGTFTIPAGASASTIFEFTLVGGGGGGGGCGTGGGLAAGGGSGAAAMISLTGFNASDTVAVTVGAAGTGGTGGGSGHAGGTGGTTALTYSATVIASATGGTGAMGTNGVNSLAGSAGTFSTSVGSTGLTQNAALGFGAQDGIGSLIVAFGDTSYSPGGNNAFGVSGTVSHPAGQLGGGGFGCIGPSVPGGAGGSGLVVVRWVL